EAGGGLAGLLTRTRMNALRAAVLVVGGVLATVAAAARWQPADGAAAPGAPEALGPVLTGRVVDENGAAVPGVKIQLYSGLATRWEGQSTTTDADGVYRFEPLEIGSMGWRGEGENREAFYYVGVRI